MVVPGDFSIIEEKNGSDRISNFSIWKGAPYIITDAVVIFLQFSCTPLCGKVNSSDISHIIAVKLRDNKLS